MLKLSGGGWIGHWLDRIGAVCGHTPEYVHDLNELVAAFPEHDRAKLLGDNARALFDLPAGPG